MLFKSVFISKRSVSYKCSIFINVIEYKKYINQIFNQIFVEETEPSYNGAQLKVCFQFIHVTLCDTITSIGKNESVLSLRT